MLVNTACFSSEKRGNTHIRPARAQVSVSFRAVWRKRSLKTNHIIICWAEITPPWYSREHGNDSCLSFATAS